MRKLISFLLTLCLILSLGVISFAESDPTALKPGDVIELGSYEQDNITGNGPEPIVWQFLYVDGDEAFLVSVYALDTMKFNETVKSLERTYDQLWAESDIRAWLNQDFLETAFDENEKMCLIPVENEGNAVDLVFLLSKEELLKYFPSDYDQLCDPTEFATVKEGSRDKARQLGVELLSPTCEYFLRSFNPTDKRVDLVKFKDISKVEYTVQGFVRPAIKISIKTQSTDSAGSKEIDLFGDSRTGSTGGNKGTDRVGGREPVTASFLVGYWSSRNGMHTFEMKKDYGYITTVPVVPRSGDAYDLIDGILYKYFMSNPSNKTPNLKFTKISDTEIEVYSYQTNTSYTLIKRR